MVIIPATRAPVVIYPRTPEKKWELFYSTNVVQNFTKLHSTYFSRRLFYKLSLILRSLPLVDDYEYHY